MNCSKDTVLVGSDVMRGLNVFLHTIAKLIQRLTQHSITSTVFWYTISNVSREIPWWGD